MNDVDASIQFCEVRLFLEDICGDELAMELVLIFEEIISKIQESLMEVTSSQGFLGDTIGHQPADVLSEAATQVEIFVVAGLESLNDFRVCIETT